MTIEASRADIVAIQSLRGIAALLIVIYHLENQMVRLGADWPHIAALQAGVDIFFVISGFIMWTTTSARPDRTAALFYRDRIIRIAPLYWLMTAFLVFVLAVAPGAAETAVFDAVHILKSFLFIPAEHPATGFYQPTLILGWTLNLEMFFYLIFGAAIALGGRNLNLRAGMLLLALSALVVVGAWLQPGGVVGFYTQDIVLEFGAGVLIGILHGRQAVRPTRWSWLFVGGGFAALALVAFFPLQLPRALEWGLPAAAIVAGAVFVPPVSMVPLQRLGDISYSLYLTHPITLAVLGKAWSEIGAAPPGLFPLVALPATIAVAGLTYRFAEVPLMRLAKRRFATSTPSPERQGAGAC